MCYYNNVINTKEKRKERMNKIEYFKGVTIIVFLFLAVGICGWYETHYTRTGTVVRMRDDVAIIEDTCGFEWGYEDESLKVGDNVKMRMCTNGTDCYVEDDIIEKIEVCGGRD